ncbi:hypothetical protein KI387_012591, partial [Taxus chinensis]
RVQQKQAGYARIRRIRVYPACFCGTLAVSAGMFFAISMAENVFLLSGMDTDMVYLWIQPGYSKKQAGYARIRCIRV